jgi:hypothetical protein
MPNARVLRRAFGGFQFRQPLQRHSRADARQSGT